MENSDKPVVIIGAGPSGLTAAWQFAQEGMTNFVVVEQDPTSVGGNARTFAFEGYRIDVGGHRLSATSQEILEIWNKIMPNELVETAFEAHVMMKGEAFAYPLRMSDVLLKLGPFETLSALLGFVERKIFPRKPERSFEDWVCNRFGDHLHRLVFKDYTEKMWGVSCDQISSTWASQRIQGDNSLYKLLVELIQSARGKAKTQRFLYPRLGPGQMWENAAEQIRVLGGQIFLDFKVQTIHWDEEGVSHITGIGTQGGFYQQEGSHFISSMPLRDLLLSMDPPPPKAVLTAAKGLRYRDLITVVLVVNEAKVFSDLCLYINDPSVRVSQIQNYKNFSSAMVENKNLTTLGMDYFCFENDNLWKASDAELAELAASEVVQLKLVSSELLLQASVLRTSKAYPIYDHEYPANVATIKEWLNYFYNLHPVGRNGLHRYSSQDHSMMTSVLATRNIKAEDRIFDCWEVSSRAEYQPRPRSN